MTKSDVAAAPPTHAKYPFYQYYSWWTLGLVALYLAGAVPFSVLPTALMTFLGAVVFLSIKYRKNKTFNVKLAIIILIVHATPFAILPLRVTYPDVIYNAIIFMLYLMSLALQNTNMFEAYYKLLEWDDNNLTIYNYYKALGVIP